MGYLFIRTSGLSTIWSPRLANRKLPRLWLIPFTLSSPNSSRHLRCHILWWQSSLCTELLTLSSNSHLITLNSTQRGRQDRSSSFVIPAFSIHPQVAYILRHNTVTKGNIRNWWRTLYNRTLGFSKIKTNSNSCKLLKPAKVHPSPNQACKYTKAPKCSENIT